MHHLDHKYQVLALVTDLFLVNLLNRFFTHCIISIVSVYFVICCENSSTETRPLQIVIPCLMIILCMLCTWEFCSMQHMANVLYLVDPQR